MGLVRTLARRVAESIAGVVARNELFEKPGERAPTSKLPESPSPESDEPSTSDLTEGSSLLGEAT